MPSLIYLSLSLMQAVIYSPFYKKSKLIGYYCLPDVTPLVWASLFLFSFSQIKVGTYKVSQIRFFYFHIANKMKNKSFKETYIKIETELGRKLHFLTPGPYSTLYNNYSLLFIFNF